MQVINGGRTGRATLESMIRKSLSLEVVSYKLRPRVGDSLMKSRQKRVLHAIEKELHISEKVKGKCS